MRHAARRLVRGAAFRIAALVLALVAPPADAQLLRYEFSELHMGMRVRMVVYTPNEAEARDAVRSAFGRIAALEDILSDWRPSSELRRLGTLAAGVRATLSVELCTVLGAALDLARRTGGAFDPTVGPFVALWREARRTGRMPADEALEHARSRAGWQRVRLDTASCTVTFDADSVRLDLGGIAKGYILDEALRTLEMRGVRRAMVEAGGDIVVGDAPPGQHGWAIVAPHDEPALAARARALVRAAIATSGDTEQSVTIDGVRYSHVVDPRTGLGLTRGVMATVIAQDGLTTDGLATALTVLGAEGLAIIPAYPGAVAALRSPVAERR
ncbi:MAG TPA: FAD:protein FMN transferase [Gemmatimonadaceae bacterium]|nr:FAD:protein FMN transferase [Gemmatimonadaceae bacterium]